MLERRDFLKFFLCGSLFLFNYQISRALDQPRNTKVLSSKIFKKFAIDVNHPEKPDRIKFIKRLIKNSNLINIYENYEDYRNIENWIELIHSKEHINTLKSNFSLAEKVSRHAVSICLEGVDRIMQKK